MNRVLWLLGLCVMWGSVATAGTYHDNNALESALRSLGNGFAVEELTRDPQGRPIWMVTAGSKDPTDPAILVVAGLDGRHLVGTEMALAHLQDLAADSEALDGRTLYVIPRFNPGGADAMFTTPREELASTPGVRDTDRDGLVGEDLRDDLDGNDRLTLVRVEDPDGEYALDGDGDFLRKADAAKGETGGWRILTEGRDDDGDEAWNEEADGGVSLARCFPYEFPWFERDAGAHQMDRPEARALGDFLAAHPNIAVAVVYGFEDNLLTSPSDKDTSDPDLRGSRFGRAPLTKPNKHDVPILRELGERYRSALDVPKDAKHLSPGEYGVLYKDLGPGYDLTAEETAKGGLAGFLYFHRGRLALATPAWTPGLQMAWVDAAKAAEESESENEDSEEDSGGSDDAEDDAATEETSDDDAKPKDERVARDQAYRDWLVANQPSGWLGWTQFDHPDFPGQRAEAGGYAPFASLNPPLEQLDSLATKHNRFFREVLGSLPQVVIRTASLRALGGGAHELKVTVENRGFLPDVMAQGVYATHARDTRVEITGGEVLGGSDRVTLDRIAGSGRAEEIRRIVHLPSGGSVTVRVVSEMAGTDELTLRPGETKEGGAQ